MAAWHLRLGPSPLHSRRRVAGFLLLELTLVVVTIAFALADGGDVALGGASVAAWGIFVTCLVMLYLPAWLLGTILVQVARLQLTAKGSYRLQGTASGIVFFIWLLMVSAAYHIIFDVVNPLPAHSNGGCKFFFL